MPLAPRSRLGPYEVVAPLGSGGMGEVYRARDPRLGRDVAIKVLPVENTPSPEQLRRFEGEARAAGALNHPNLLSVLDVGSDQGAPYVVFELLEGETLRERLNRGPMPFRKAVEYAVQVCQGLGAAHSKGIIHRDLKPANLFMTRDGRAKILDFGLAKLTAGPDQGEVTSSAPTRTATAPGLLVGTFAYMSPEQAGGHPVDARSDLFALGAILYEMLSGRPAFQRATLALTLSAILSHDPVVVEVTPEGPIPPALDQIVKRCLEKNPEERFQSARDLGFALGALSASTPSAPTAPLPSVGRRPTWVLPVFVGVLLAAGLVAALWTRGRSRPAVPKASLTTVPFTSFPGHEQAPTFSPDGSQIAFSWGGEAGDRGDDLYVKVIGSEKPLRLTNHPAAWIVPAWSPDGRQIAFSRWAEGGNGVYLIPALGGPERKIGEITTDYSLTGILSWSADGKRLAHAAWNASERVQTIAVLDLETQVDQRVALPSSDCQWTWVPAFSPDGRWLAFTCLISYGVNNVYVMPAPGGPARKVTVVNGDLAGLTFSSTSEKLIFAADGDLWQVPLSGGDAERVLSGHAAHFPAVSRDGRRFAYSEEILNVNIWAVPLAAPDRASGPAAPLISSSRSQHNPAYSPDGRRIAFGSNRTGSQEIWISDADGSNPVPLTSFGATSAGSPRWSPDGRRIALDSRVSGQGEIYVVRAEGGPTMRVATGVADSSLPAWSTDGSWLFFTGRANNTNQIFKVRPDGGTAIQLTHRGGAVPHDAPDGRRAYYVGPAGRVFFTSVEGGEEREVVGMPARAAKWTYDWAVTSQGIYFVEGEPPRPHLDWFDFATGKVHRVFDTPGRPEEWGGGLAVSPDGLRLLYSQLDGLSGDIILVEGFPP